IARHIELLSCCANCLGETDNLLNRFAFHVKCDQKRADLSIRALTAQHLAHNRARFVTRERLAMIRDSMQDVDDHCPKLTIAMRHASQMHVIEPVCRKQDRSIKSRVCCPQSEAAS